MASLERRKPTPQGTGSQERICLAAIYPDNSETPLDLQAEHVSRRWKLSLPLARCTAELAFGSEVRT